MLHSKRKITIQDRFMMKKVTVIATDPLRGLFWLCQCSSSFCFTSQSNNISYIAKVNEFVVTMNIGITYLDAGHIVTRIGFTNFKLCNNMFFQFYAGIQCWSIILNKLPCSSYLAVFLEALFWWLWSLWISTMKIHFLNFNQLHWFQDVWLGCLEDFTSF